MQSSPWCWRLVLALGLVLWLGAGCDDNGGGGGGGNGSGTGAESLVGVWQWQSGASGELLLQDNGQFSQTVRWNGLMTYDVGLYEVGDGFIHFAVQDHEPKEYQGQPLSYPTSFTYFYRWVGADHVVFEDHIVNTEWDAYRQ
jgi:hypothetical protein